MKTKNQIQKQEYSACLQDYENECSLNCGCKLERADDGTTAVFLTFCPKHEAAS